MTDVKSRNQATLAKKRVFSPIWFLPLLAAILGGWLLLTNITNANESISIHFTNAEGIIVDKTRIRYKGVIVGTVKKIELDSRSGINITATIESHATSMLRENTQFWLVSPQASLTAISGLDTLFSGSYINLHPGNGDTRNNFEAVSEPPVYIPKGALLVNLKSKQADSIGIATPLFYKKIKVGEVIKIQLAKDTRNVDISAFIDKKYSYLLHANSKFWNISGLNANISSNGFDLKIASISALIAGGITFSSPDNSPKLSTQKIFTLYNDFKESQHGVTITLILKSTENLSNGADIRFKGHNIGHLTEIKYVKNKKYFIAKATITPEFSDLMTQNAQFWLEKTSISFTKISNVSNIVRGNYIAFAPSIKSNATPKKQFNVNLEQLPLKPDLTLHLLTEDATGLNKNDPIQFQGIKIGEISRLHISNSGKFIEVMMQINTKYRYLINKQSKFYLLSGVNLQMSFTGIKLQSSPLENIISGGIGLYNQIPIPRNTPVSTLSKHQIFRLYASRAIAKEGKDIFTSPLTVNILSTKLPALNVGSPVYYHKFPIGEISSFNFDDSGLIRTTLIIKGSYKHLINAESVFWNVSGFKLSADLQGIKMQAESLLAITSGGIAVEQGNANINNRFKNGAYKLFASYQEAANPEKSITIIFENANNLKVGNKLKSNGLVIGEVKNLSLDENNKIQVIANIKAPFIKQVLHKNSRFWVVSSHISLSGAKNLSTLISGDYINVSPGNGQLTSIFKGELNEPLLPKNKQGLTIILLANNAGSTNIGSPVYHRQIQIGEVIAKQLNNDASGVEITLNIYPKYTTIIRQNSIFWPASGFNLDVGISGATLKTTSLTSLVKGGINMSTNDRYKLQAPAESNAHFTLQLDVQDKWFNWQLSIPKT
ncbi:PqiB family protein [Psychromonas sp. CD1]|uniref:PqiB family protein n=1 Tax=Psychromonas sp. CD1 TaxID=1979839 RepID=UPI000B9A3F5E|nr:MlaD family protein [Psychromonas sp. CD1]